MRLFPLVLALAALTVHAQAPETPLAIGSQRVPVRVTIGATSLTYSGEDTPTQLMVPASITAPAGRGVVVGVRSAYAVAGLGDTSAIEGLADIQATASYFREVGSGSVVLSIGVNVPTGKSRFTSEQAATAYLVGQPFYKFALPTWGQGLNLAPSIAYAFPISGRAAVGVAVSYRTRGAFEPYAIEGAELDPGGEATLTAGVDLEVAPSTVLAIDVSGVQYGTDTYAGADYQVGNAVAGTAELVRETPGLRLRLLGRASARGEGAPPPVASIPDARIPFQARLLGEATVALGGSLSIGALVQGRSYAASDAFGDLSMLDVVLSPRLTLGRALSIQARVGATLGDLEGALVGASMTVGR